MLFSLDFTLFTYILIFLSNLGSQNWQTYFENYRNGNNIWSGNKDDRISYKRKSSSWVGIHKAIVFYTLQCLSGEYITYFSFLWVVQLISYYCCRQRWRRVCLPHTVFPHSLGRDENVVLLLAIWVKYHNALCLSPQILHKHCFCFLLGPL